MFRRRDHVFSLLYELIAIHDGLNPTILTNLRAASVWRLRRSYERKNMHRIIVRANITASRYEEPKTKVSTPSLQLLLATED